MAKLPNMANKMLAQIYVCLDRQQDAEDAIATLLENQPDYTIAKVRRGLQSKYKGPGMEKTIDAGLPE